MHDDKFTKGMRGEFRGDFTRDTFDPSRHFSRVLMQQGRVQLDADWNEQVSIFSSYLRRLGADIMGSHGVPCTDEGEEGEGFSVTNNGKTFNIAAGHYYVNGILCENDEEKLTYWSQLNLPFPEDHSGKFDPGKYLVYLDVWERHLSYVEDDYMREKALGGPDTATRAKIVWQVKVKETGNFSAAVIKKFKKNHGDFLHFLASEIKPGSTRLRARARKKEEDNKDPCLTSPEARYRGPENQLYRVEIHANSETEGGPTFKWSRENGSVIFPIKEINDREIILEHLGRDKRFGLKPNDWVEIVDDDYILQNRAEALLQIEEIVPENMKVTLKNSPGSKVGNNKHKHRYLRRWDQQDGDAIGVPVNEGDQEEDWILLEDGVQVQFFPSEDASGKHVYQTGDYWLVPARTSTGDVEWPGPVDDPEFLPPQGVAHHYAPLAYVKVDSSGDVSLITDLRRKLIQIWG